MQALDVETDDRKWLEGMWSTHADQVYAYAARRLGSELAEDVVADTFVVAWRNRTHRPHRELPWLYGVARKVIRDRYRSQDRWTRLQQRIEVNRPSLADTVAEPASAAVAANHALAALDEADRETLLLVSWEGLDTREASAALGVTPAAFRMRLTRARRRLTAHMQASGLELTEFSTLADGGKDAT
jgi:RNA polymerase sigma-70 factor, ECF subfamily